MNLSIYITPFEVVKAARTHKHTSHTCVFCHVFSGLRARTHTRV